LAEVITRLSLRDYGVTPGSEWVEARALHRGFSVVVWDSDFSRRPRRRYVSAKSYSWRAFARSLSNLSTSDWINPDPAAASSVVVEGTGGLVAEILRYAYASGDGGTPEFVRLLIQQRDDCLSRLENAIGERISDELQAQLSQIASDLDELALEPDLCAIARLATEDGGLDVNSIAAYLSTEVEAKHHEDARWRERQISPFRARIEAFVSKFDDRSLRGGGMLFPSARRRVRRFLEDYAIANGRLPDGPTRVNSESRSYLWDLGIIDFSGIYSPRRK
jgi:hypothetical protein